MEDIYFVEEVDVVDFVVEYLVEESLEAHPFCQQPKNHNFLTENQYFQISLGDQVIYKPKLQFKKKGERYINLQIVFKKVF